MDLVLSYADVPFEVAIVAGVVSHAQVCVVVECAREQARVKGSVKRLPAHFDKASVGKQMR